MTPHAAIDGHEPGRDRQPHRPPRRGLARARSSSCCSDSARTGSRASSRRSKATADAAPPAAADAAASRSCRRITTCAPSDVMMRRLHGTLAAAADARPGRFRRAAAGAGRRRAHGAVAGDGGRGGARRAVPLRRSGALLARAWRQGPPPLSGAAQGLRRDDRRAEVGARQAPSSATTRSSTRIRRLDDQARAARARIADGPVVRRLHRARSGERSHRYGGRSVFGWEPPPGKIKSA